MVHVAVAAGRASGRAHGQDGSRSVYITSRPPGCELSWGPLLPALLPAGAAPPLPTRCDRLWQLPLIPFFLLSSVFTCILSIPTPEGLGGHVSQHSAQVQVHSGLGAGRRRGVAQHHAPAAVDRADDLRRIGRKRGEADISNASRLGITVGCAARAQPGHSQHQVRRPWLSQGIQHSQGTAMAPSQGTAVAPSQGRAPSRGHPASPACRSARARRFAAAAPGLPGGSAAHRSPGTPPPRSPGLTWSRRPA